MMILNQGNIALIHISKNSTSQPLTNLSHHQANLLSKKISPFLKALLHTNAQNLMQLVSKKQNKTNLPSFPYMENKRDMIK